MPKISVIIPMYNGGRYIRRCLKSIYAQTFQDFEVILLDDGSTDDSCRIAEEYINSCKTYREKTRLIKKENEGVALTRNRGIRLAAGEYIAFADQDDFMAKGYLAAYLKAAEENDADIVSGGYERIGADGRILVKRTLKNKPWAKYTMIVPWAHLYKRSFVLANSLEFLDNGIGEDICFTLPAYEATDKIVIIPDRGYKWFYNTESVSNTGHKTLDSRQNVIFLLDEVYKRLMERQRQDSKSMEYFFLRFICWYLLYSVRGSRRENIESAYGELFGWLKGKYPEYRKNPHIRFKMPPGEELKFHIYVTVFYCLERVGALKTVLKLFGN